MSCHMLIQTLIYYKTNHFTGNYLCYEMIPQKIHVDDVHLPLK